MLVDLGVDGFIESVAEQAAVHGPQPVCAAAARALADVAGVDLDPDSLRLFASTPSECSTDDEPATADVVELAPAPDLRAVSGAAPDPAFGGDGGADLRCPAAILLGRCLEATLTDAQRVIGAHHTPFDASSRVVDLTLMGQSLEREDARAGATVCDPAVGGGVFLIAVADRLVTAGLDRPSAVAALWGFDLNPIAVAVTEAALALWAGVSVPEAAMQVCVGDFLLDDVVDAVMPAGGWSHIVGNPPFQSQLSGRTARHRARAEALLDRYGDTARGYADEAALFLLAGAERLRDNGRIALIVPTSVCASRDGAPIRKALDVHAPLCGLWVPDGQVFPAAVDTVAPVLSRGAATDSVQLVVGRPDGFDELRTVDAVGERWSELLADADGVPRVELDPGAVLGDLAETTAGFRQHFYAVARAAIEAVPVPDSGSEAKDRPVVTVGLIDPLASHWGGRSTRLGGVTFQAPVVQVASIDDDEVTAWVEQRRRPKVLVATQTRVLEACVDPVGDLLPSTPVISVEPTDPTDIWLVAAALCAPPITAWLHRRAAGGGLSRGRVKPSASLIRSIPLPTDRAAWIGGADLAEVIAGEADSARRRAGLIELGGLMTSAYGAAPPLTDWWRQLLPAVR